MDKVKKAIKCVNCLEVLKSPVLLPCSHSICNKHLTEGDKETIKCGLCKVDHLIPENEIGFPKNQALEDVIASNVDSFNFGKISTGKIHVEAIEQCNKVESVLKRLDLLLTDPSSYVREEINELRIRVRLKSEQLKLDVEKKSKELLDLLNEYEKRCLLASGNNLTRISNETSRRAKSDEVRRQARLHLKKWKHDLNEMKFNGFIWFDIKEESKNFIPKLETWIGQYKNDFFLGQNHLYAYKVERFEKFNIDISFK